MRVVASCMQLACGYTCSVVIATAIGMSALRQTIESSLYVINAGLWVLYVVDADSRASINSSTVAVTEVICIRRWFATWTPKYLPECLRNIPKFRLRLSPASRTLTTASWSTPIRPRRTRCRVQRVSIDALRFVLSKTELYSLQRYHPNRCTLTLTLTHLRDRSL